MLNEYLIEFESHKEFQNYVNALGSIMIEPDACEDETEHGELVFYAYESIEQILEILKQNHLEIKVA